MSRRRTIGRVWWLATLLCYVGCGVSLPAKYAQSTSAASAAYSAGHYAEAAGHWSAAAATAPDRHHRDEAEYRRAASLWKGKHLEAARQQLSKLKDKPGRRQARAAFDHAYVTLELGDQKLGLSLLKGAVAKHPESGNLERALRLLLERTRDESGLEGAFAVSSELAPSLKGSDGEQPLLYFRARLLEDSKQVRAALRQYKLLNQRFPYPEGVYWDEANLRSVELLVQLGETQQAAASLENMLKEREGSAIVGSYERRFSTAHFRLAEMYRDEQNDWKRARKEFRRVFDLYEDSVIRDDALWQASLLSRRYGAPGEACDDLEGLRAVPDSRFHRCASLVCEELKTDNAKCPAYIQRELVADGPR